MGCLKSCAPRLFVRQPALRRAPSSARMGGPLLADCGVAKMLSGVAHYG
jgi:hypothetical protein